MNKNTSVIMASVIVAVLAVGIAAPSVIQSVLASRDVGFGTDGDSGGNGGAFQSGGTATSGAAIGQVNTGAGKANTGDWGSGVGQTGGTSNAIGCGHIGAGTSVNNC